MSPGGLIFVLSPPKTGINLRHPRPPKLLNDSEVGSHRTDVQVPVQELLGIPPYRSTDDV